MKLWGGRFRKDENKLMEEFNSSFSIDKRLINVDIQTSIAHVSMLIETNIIQKNDGISIIEGLKKIKNDIYNEILKVDGDYEDVHSFLEATLIKYIGEVGKKLHTARSRNDLIATDMKLYTKTETSYLILHLKELKTVLVNVAEENKKVILPGYTHLQRAQVVTFKHHLLAYTKMLSRDIQRLENALILLNESPLGAGALAGTTHDIDRNMTSKQLGFDKPNENFLDSVSDRDYLIEITSCMSIVMMHLSRLSEELILWNCKEFDFIEIDDAYSTGSSIMPQKKNPDAAELIRGRTGIVYGSLTGLLTIMKSLPLAYNKDMQEDKKFFFDSIDTTIDCIRIMTNMVQTLKVKSENMKKSVKKGFLNATDLADYLVRKGVHFRDAHAIVGEIVIECENNDVTIQDISLERLKKFSEVIEEDVYGEIDEHKTLKKGNKKYML
ncbi:argininosuccinate lyase [Mammaliicoccus lentus]|uniref:argininosuccinate lyase n=1 Tax=Mammaliicoccus lentus TaxID=42858 RepID=UPI0026479CB5|nr:argininosuccinate lyase [Mammaliicoccus lentus]